jgi:hypothetical protein
MTSSTVDPTGEHVPARLLAHFCEVDSARPDAYTRLREELGDHFARVLVFALADPQGRRGSSSP